MSRDNRIFANSDGSGNNGRGFPGDEGHEELVAGPCLGLEWQKTAVTGVPSVNKTKVRSDAKKNPLDSWYEGIADDLGHGEPGRTSAL